MHNGRGDDDIVIGRIATIAPEQFSIARRDTDDTAVDDLDNLFDAADLGQDWRGITRLVRHFLALPENLAGLLIERGEESMSAARHANEPVAIDQRGPGVSPTERSGLLGAAADRIDFAAQFARQVFAPAFLAGGGIDADQIAEAAEREGEVAINCGRGVGAFVPVVSFPGKERADFRGPKLLHRLARGTLGIERD